MFTRTVTRTYMYCVTHILIYNACATSLRRWTTPTLFPLVPSSDGSIEVVGGESVLDLDLCFLSRG